MESHNVDGESDQVEDIEYVLIDEFLNFIGTDISFINGGGDDHLILDGDVVVDILQEEYDYVFSGYQMLHHVGKGIIEMGLDVMASTSDLLPHDLIEDNIFHEVI